MATRVRSPLHGAEPGFELTPSPNSVACAGGYGLITTAARPLFGRLALRTPRMAWDDGGS